jgi:hypothetical protein
MITCSRLAIGGVYLTHHYESLGVRKAVLENRAEIGAEFSAVPESLFHQFGCFRPSRQHGGAGVMLGGHSILIWLTFISLRERSQSTLRSSRTRETTDAALRSIPLRKPKRFRFRARLLQHNRITICIVLVNTLDGASYFTAIRRQAPDTIGPVRLIHSLEPVPTSVLRKRRWFHS